MSRFLFRRADEEQRSLDDNESASPGLGVLETVRWGPQLMPLSEQAQHFAAIGNTGSGKTTLVRLAMQDVIPAIGPGTNSRAIIYNAKRDVLPILASIAPNTPVVNMDPLDRRSAAWDIARDVTEPAVAIEIARTLIPDVSESQPFFADAARHLLVGVMLSFILRAVDWSLADLLRAFSTAGKLRNVLLACRYTRTLVPRYFQDERLLSNILSTFATKAMSFEPLAAAWEHAERKVSVTDWIDNEFVLVLGNNETSKHALNTVNRCVFKRACDLAINQVESSIRRSWFIVDELPEIGKLDGLLSLCKKGRSKGACVVIAFQSVAGLREAKLYGKDGTAEILDQIGHFAIGRVGPDTAEWVSNLIGEQEVREVTENHSYGGSHSVSYNESFKTRKAVLPSELMAITPCSLQSGLTAYYVTRTEESVFRTTLSGENLFKRDLIPPDEQTPEFIPRPADAQLLRPWTKNQRSEFAPLSTRRKASRSRPSGHASSKVGSVLQALQQIS